MRGIKKCCCLPAMACGLLACGAPGHDVAEARPKATPEEPEAEADEPAEHVPTAEDCEPEECLELGQFIYMSWSTEDVEGIDMGDKSKARLLFEKSCEGGQEEGCYLAAEMWAEGSGGPKDASRAWAYYEKACEMEWEDACLALAQDQAYVPKDKQKAKQIYLEACDLEEERACLLLMTEHGMQPEDLPTVSIAALAEALWLGTVTIIEDKKLARSLFKLACDDEWDEACVSLAEMHRRGEGGSKDSKKARLLFAAACKWPKEITHKTIGKTGIVEAADTVCEHVECEFAIEAACQALAQLWEKGQGGPKSTTMARALYAAACYSKAADSFDSCHTLGKMLLAGEGGPESEDQASTAFDRGCEGGNKQCCDSIAKM